jgi:hypothetical protein
MRLSWFILVGNFAKHFTVVDKYVYTSIYMKREVKWKWLTLHEDCLSLKATSITAGCNDVGGAWNKQKSVINFEVQISLKYPKMKYTNITVGWYRNIHEEYMLWNELKLARYRVQWQTMVLVTW